MLPHQKSLNVDICTIRGFFPIFQVGDVFNITQSYTLVSNQPIYLHALQEHVAYYIPLSLGTSHYDLVFTSKEKELSYNPGANPMPRYGIYNLDWLVG
jgi:hypothetical protein